VGLSLVLEDLFLTALVFALELSRVHVDLPELLFVLPAEVVPLAHELQAVVFDDLVAGIDFGFQVVFDVVDVPGIPVNICREVLVQIDAVVVQVVFVVVLIELTEQLVFEFHEFLAVGTALEAMQGLGDEELDEEGQVVINELVCHDGAVLDGADRELELPELVLDLDALVLEDTYFQFVHT